jgi:hypothetical protein
MVMTDEEAARHAIQSFASADNLSQEQNEANAQARSIISSDEPFVDIHLLFGYFDKLYFQNLLVPRVEVSWRPKLTYCAGMCELLRDPQNDNKYTRIRLKLSEALLKYRPRSDVVDTLLHEAIHAYFFVTSDWKHIRGEDGTGHGAGFVLLADAINAHGGYRVSAHHSFHDEVDSYRTHVWQCNGSCKDKAPIFGLVKRSMNRPPSKNDFWWMEHQKSCGGTFTKIAEPQLSKDQLRRLTPMQRAGRQTNKIDNWITQTKKPSQPGVKSDAGQGESSVDIASKDPGGNDDRVKNCEEVVLVVACPICNKSVAAQDINAHLDWEHVT